MFKFIVISAVFTAGLAQTPYQYSGWKPSGPPFGLPLRQQLPKPVYGPPPQEYGPPSATTTTENPEITTTELPTTTENGIAQSAKLTNEMEKLQEPASDALVQEGVYYIYHPNGLLQRVLYSTKNDVRNMAYTAQLKYQDVEPIKDPIYTYDPNTYVLQKLQILDIQ